MAEFSPLAKQWLEESAQMAPDSDELKALNEKLEESSPDEVDWYVAVPIRYPSGSKFSLAEIEKDPPEASLVEHSAVVTGIKKFHLEKGYKAADALLEFYENVYAKSHEPRADFDFQKFLFAYSSSTSKM